MEEPVKNVGGRPKKDRTQEILEPTMKKKAQLVESLRTADVLYDRLIKSLNKLEKNNEDGKNTNSIIKLYTLIAAKDSQMWSLCAPSTAEREEITKNIESTSLSNGKTPTFDLEDMN